MKVIDDDDDEDQVSPSFPPPRGVDKLCCAARLLLIQRKNLEALVLQLNDHVNTNCMIIATATTYL